jgi:hypothetical protein
MRHLRGSSLKVFLLTLGVIGSAGLGLLVAITGSS